MNHLDENAKNHPNILSSTLNVNDKLFDSSFSKEDLNSDFLDKKNKLSKKVHNHSLYDVFFKDERHLDSTSFKDDDISSPQLKKRVTQSSTTLETIKQTNQEVETEKKIHCESGESIPTSNNLNQKKLPNLSNEKSILQNEKDLCLVSKQPNEIKTLVMKSNDIGLEEPKPMKKLKANACLSNGVPKTPNKELPIESNKMAISSNTNEDLSGEYKVGDLLWSKISGHPWWPCIISPDPNNGLYTKVVMLRKLVRIYHVYYFGEENERGWTTPYGILKFEGLEAFNRYSDQQISSAPRCLKKKIIDKFTVKITRKDAWNVAVIEAEFALKASEEGRKKIINQKQDIIKSKSSKKRSLHNSTAFDSDTDTDQEDLKTTLETKTLQNENKTLANQKKGKRKLKEQKPSNSDFTSKNKKPKQNKLSDIKHKNSKEAGNSPLPSMKEPTVNPSKFPRNEFKFTNDSDSSDPESLGSTSKSEDTCIVSLSKQEKVCAICEKASHDLVHCSGLCLRSFHNTCLGLEAITGEYKCESCTSGMHKCVICQKKANKIHLKKCANVTCGKFFHESCFKKYTAMLNYEGKNNICPLHFCINCVLDNPRAINTQKTRLLRCIRCHRAYHNKQQCIAAGTLHLTPSYIICAEHLDLKRHKLSSTINTTWCFICSKGGSLICCETCPASFHAQCLNIKPPESKFFCEECESGRHPHYGDIVWAKLGAYRWWPAKICHPNDVPHNIKKENPEIGEFPVYFFGTRDYTWAHRGRIFSFQEDDDEKKDNSPHHLSLARRYNRALEEAAKEFVVLQAKREQQITEMKKHQRPPQFKMIKFNKPVGKVQIPTFNEADYNMCDCDPKSDNPCSSDIDCINRSLMFECNPNLCPAKEKCQNQRFQKCLYPAVEPFYTESRGWGLRSLEDIKKGQFVNEYVGELIDDEECERRIEKMHKENETNFYFLTIDKDHIIDAGPKGNLSRFLNHSCNPNLETQKWIINGETRIGLFALSDIPSGTELTFNYNLECRGNEKAKCMCGAPNCSKFIGVRPKNMTLEKKTKISYKKKKTKPALDKKASEDCYYCHGLGTEMIVCSHKNCPKMAHLGCCGNDDPLHGKWKCPLHVCEVCMKVSSKECSVCYRSFCREHSVGALKYVDNKYTCIKEHKS